MMTRLEWMIKNGREGVKLGIIQIDWAVKYEAYVLYLEFFESLKGQHFSGKQTPRSEALKLTAEKMRVDESTIWRYIAAFDFVAPTSDELTLVKNQRRWTFANSCNNTKGTKG